MDGLSLRTDIITRATRLARGCHGIAAVLVAVLASASPSFGASFGCGKATTAVEKMICADDTLSGLDEELDRVYTLALALVPDPDALKASQRQWLKTRNACNDARCIEQRGAARLAELRPLAQIPAMTPPPGGSTGFESRLYAREADKWPVIQQVLKQQSFSTALQTEPAYCTQVLADLKANRHIEVIEPDVSATSADDPRLALWHQCETKDWQGAVVPDAYFGINMLGGPPYRYYHIDVDGDPNNGKEHVLYHRGGTAPQRMGGTGYTWVDFEGCRIRREDVGGYDVAAFPYPPVGYHALTLLMRYRGEPMVLELNMLYPRTQADAGDKAIGYVLKVLRFGLQQPIDCKWR